MALRLDLWAVPIGVILDYTDALLKTIANERLRPPHFRGPHDGLDR